MIGRNIGYMKEIAGCTTRKALRNQLISKRGSSNYKDNVCSKGVYHIHKRQSLVEASVIWKKRQVLEKWCDKKVGKYKNCWETLDIGKHLLK